jgi:hypothetical protein
MPQKFKVLDKVLPPIAAPQAAAGGGSIPAPGSLPALVKVQREIEAIFREARRRLARLPSDEFKCLDSLITGEIFGLKKALKVVKAAAQEENAGADLPRSGG